MSIENLEEYALEKNPNMDLARWRFALSLPENKNNAALRTQLLESIRADDMAPFYEYTCLKLRWSVDKSMLSSMQAANREKLEQLDHEIEEAEMNFGQMEVREAYLKKAEYLCRIGDKEAAETAFRLTYEKTTALGQRLDIVLNLIRLGLFYMDHDLIKRNLDKANYLIEEGGDWDRRNRLKVYQGTYALSVRDFKQATELFLSTLSTFAAYELLDYNTFIRYTVYVSMVVLPRQELYDRVIRDPELQQGFHAVEDVKNFLFSLHKSQYANFFANLADVELRLRSDFFWNPHYHFYVREMRLLAYAQMLSSYRSLALQYMAESFGVDVEFIERELRTFIAAGRLYAKIDRVKAIVETNRPDSKNYQYQCAIKQGDVLLNRIQKLSRAVDK